MIMKYFVLVIFILALWCVRSDSTPVLLWDSSCPLAPTLKKLSSIEFENCILPDAEDSMVIVFMDDISLRKLPSCKPDTENKCFENLVNVKNKIYYSNVENPIEVLLNSNLQKEFIQADENWNLKNTLKYEKNKIIIVTFPDQQSLTNHLSIPDLLHKRGAAMAKIYNQISSKGKTIGMLTVQPHEKLNRFIRQTTVATNEKVEEGVFVHIDNEFLLYYTLLSLKTTTENNPVNIKLNSAQKTDQTENSFNVKLSGSNHKLEFHVTENQGYWQVQNMSLDDNQFESTGEINAANHFSYYCGDQIFYSNEKELIWKDLQIQVNFNPNKTNNKEPLQFDDPWHCVGFISAGIWSGLLVTFMLLGIMTIAISWLLDIRTMDRFDDPKGKTITVNVSE